MQSLSKNREAFHMCEGPKAIDLSRMHLPFSHWLPWTDTILQVQSLKCQGAPKLIHCNRLIGYNIWVIVRFVLRVHVRAGLVWRVYLGIWWDIQDVACYCIVHSSIFGPWWLIQKTVLNMASFNQGSIVWVALLQASYLQLELKEPPSSGLHLLQTPWASK